MPDRKAVVLLDVDGVLNVICRKNRPPKKSWEDFRFTEARVAGETFPICYSPALVARVWAVHLSGKAEVRWLTTWENHANEVLADVIGLPGQFAIAGIPPPTLALTRPPWWKLQHAQAVLAEADKLVWIDDDLKFDRPARIWCRQNPDRVLPICPDAAAGVRPEQMAKAERWLLAE